MKQEEIDSSLNYAMSTSEKRNIKRKHEKDHIEEEDSIYKNLYEWQRILNVNESKTIEMFNTIINWFNANSHNKVQHLRFKNDNIKMTSLIKHFSEKYHMYFEEQSNDFVERSITWLIQRYLFKKRRNQEKRRSQANLLLKHVDQTIIESRALSTIKSSLSLNENIILRVKRENSFEIESFCTIDDVLSKISFDTMSINFIQRIFYNKWRDILCHDLKINFDYDALYDLEDQTLKIENDRHLKIAILFEHSHEFFMIRFLIRLFKKDDICDYNRVSRH